MATIQDLTKRTNELVGNKFDPNTGVPLSNNQIITSKVLAPQSEITYQTPNPTIIPPVNGLDTTTGQATLTTPEKEASDLTSRLKALNDSLTGQSTFRAEKEAEQNLPALLKTQNELSSRLKAVQNEALAIPMQLQEDATGRGITSGGLAPIQAGALRKNAIQALSVSSLLEASKGNVSLANDLVERAVSAKFDPIKEEIATKTANLDLILKSPEYSVAEKNRAQAQKDIQDKKAKDLAKEEENTKIAQAMAAAAIKNYPSDSAASFAAQQLLKLDSSDPNYLAKAFSLVGQYQSDPAQTQKDLDAHLQAQANLSLTKANVAKAYADARKADGTTGSSGSYVYKEGEDPIVDSWASRIQNGTAKITEIPTSQAGLRNKVSVALSSMGNSADGKPTTTELGKDALVTAKELMTKFDSGTGTGAVGGSRFWTAGAWTSAIPGSAQSNFVIDFNSLKSKLALEGIKYLKGQGQVSDAERALLSSAVSKLSLSQGEAEFKKTLQGVIDKLEGNISKNETLLPPTTTLMTGPDGVDYQVPNNQVEAFRAAGGKIK